MGTCSEVPLKPIWSATAGVAENAGTLAAVIAGAAPGVPPRTVVRTTWLGGSAVPLFRFANLFLQPPPLPPLLRFLLRSNLRAVAAVDERRSPYECSDDKTYQKKCSCKLSVHKTRNLIEWNIDGNDPRDILEGEEIGRASCRERV